jgi:protoporphyrinogen/coproporphyrinogen III oxidase
MPGPGTSLFSNLYSLVSEPVFDGLFPSILMEPLQPPRPDHLSDESIASFLSRRLGSPLLADNILSAVFHGIYAGDIHQLSARSLLSRAWQFERRYGSFFKAAWAQMRGGVAVPILKEDLTLLKERSTIAMENQSVFTFIGGIGELANAIVAELENNPNVEIRKETHVQQLKLENNTPDPKVRMPSIYHFSEPCSAFSTKMLY